mgnify:CR=1 FL=1
MKILLSGLLMIISINVMASDVAIIFAKFSRNVDGSWNVAATLKHADSGWNHYANEWRIVDGKGHVIGKRVLAHPHVEEQPFTRRLYSLKIPVGVADIFVEASDSVNGRSPDRIKVDLTKRSGDRFSVE